jgi:hypothetical protein
MNKTAKIIISVVAVFVVLMIFAAMAGAASDAGGHVPGIIGLILFGGLYGGLKAMWKDDKKKGEDDKDKNNSILQK